MTNSIGDVDEADLLFVIGSNTTEQHPIIGARIIRAVSKGAKLILVDNRRIPLSKFATVHIRPRNGTDVALINGFMNVIIEEGLAKTDFIESCTENFEALRETVAIYTPARVAALAGVAEEDIRRAARLYANAGAAMLLYGMGITQHSHGVDNVTTLANLAMLTGQVGRPGTGINPLRGQNNVQGACDMGALPNVFTGYRPVTDEAARRDYEACWGVSDLPSRPGIVETEAVLAAERGEIKGFFIVGENPLMFNADAHAVRRAFERVELVVVQDIFLTETAKVADVVLPAASFAEKDGTFTNTERRVLRVRRAIEPLEGCRSDWRIFCDLARAAGHAGMDYESPEEIFEEMRTVTPIYTGMTYARLEGDGLQWPCPDESHPGTPILHKDGQFKRGKGRFVPAGYVPPAEVPDEEYDFLLTTGRDYYHFHTGTMTRKTTTLEREVHHAYAEINIDDAKVLDIRTGTMLRVASRRGEIEIEARVTDNVPSRVVFIPFHFTEAAANELTNHALDPVAKIPEYKVCAVKLRRVS
jgi:formate dehydrogenase alpha subunit